MTDGILAPTDKQDLFSELYVSAVAVEAGYTVSKANLDRDGIDLSIKSGGGMRPQIDCQLKATVNLGKTVGGNYRFPLKVRNYELLRMDTIIPRVLVVYQMPPSPREWINICAEELSLRTCAFWSNLAGLPATSNIETITVDVPEANALTVEGLKAMMQRAREGGRI